MLEDTNSKAEFLSSESFYRGLKDTSKTKLDMLVAEYPKLRNFIFRLKNKTMKVRFSIEELKEIWELSKKDALVIANRLVKLGYFKNESDSESSPKYFIPVIFRSALGFSASQ